MSSEEIRSVVESEVMPLDYGSMDSESSQSPSSSEKTMEGVKGDEVVEVGGNEVVEVGGTEVVGVGGDSIPITVVEVEGRGERDYDVNAEIVEKVKQYRSELKTKDSLGHLVENYEISSRVLVRPAGGGSMRDKGWYYFTPRVANKESRSLFTAGPSSIKGWKEKFFFVDDTEWERGMTRRSEEAGEEGGDLLNILDLTSAQCIEAAELYGPSALSEAEMNQFLNTAGGVAIPKKPRKKSKTSTKQVDEGRARKEKKVVEEEERGNEVPQFVSQPPPVELNPELRRLEEGTEHLPRSGQTPRRDEALRYGGASVVKHVLEEFMESMKERSLLERQCDQLQKEKEELEKKNKELQESLNEVVPTVKQLEQERASLSTKLIFEESKRRISKSEREAQAQEIKLMKEAFMELKENVQTLVHNGMKEHISNFISSSSFDNIVNLYRLPTAIIAFTDCRKKVKAEYPEVDITKITFGEQEEGVEEDGESMSANFCPQIKLRWEHDENGRAVFSPQFDFEFVAVEEEGAKVEEDEVEAGVEGAEVDESQPVPEVEIHSVPSDNEQPPLPDEQQPTQPPPPAEQEPVEPPRSAEK
ncbi:hypothetical protein SLEP1_g54793 [Rubroshorea leprosula]|uniref:Uncharacterized protein n=1 Tax=Rubroshorea leprosula TaxID=152421 RepID=A0AAV5MEP5_9ROSI|nr:hypothetical protein SLEP1_g54793 [Rubroshorea leprosula]